jgi:hypothetical protein
VGVQSSFNKEEHPDVILEVVIRYAGTVGVSCMDEVVCLNKKFRELPGKVEVMDMVMTNFDGWLLMLEEREITMEEVEARVSGLTKQLVEEKRKVEVLGEG